ncbi:hypothetical protein EYF80_037781 [Liparis tanakae]|uniref:Secreted protein n=1 Tax=Liparis tanakae TaxID=230148 RepID=A0A4Z2GET1_9TELE|nr:hypothetical protein EYF80_037781 [Liparis tanakae]
MCGTALLKCFHCSALKFCSWAAYSFLLSSAIVSADRLTGEMTTSLRCGSFSSMGEEKEEDVFRPADCIWELKPACTQ